MTEATEFIRSRPDQVFTTDLTPLKEFAAKANESLILLDRVFSDSGPYLSHRPEAERVRIAIGLIQSVQTELERLFVICSTGESDGQGEQS